MKKTSPYVLMAILLALLLVACGKAQNSSAKAVEDYLKALANKDSTALSSLSCADWESNAMLELDALQAVSTRLEGLTCTAGSTSGTTTDVNCKGSIVTTYNGEDTQLDLSARTYQVVKQGGDYLVCGYK